VRERDAHSSARRSSSRHVRYRAVPRANRIPAPSSRAYQQEHTRVEGADIVMQSSGFDPLSRERTHAFRSRSNMALHSALNFRPFGVFGNAFGPSSFRTVCSKFSFGFSQAQSLNWPTISICSVLNAGLFVRLFVCIVCLRLRNTCFRFVLRIEHVPHNP
jgi:hypothetical protein